MSRRKWWGVIIAAASGCAALSLLAFIAIEWATVRVVWTLRGEFTVSQWRNEEGCLEMRHIRTGMVMILVPGGTFAMGASGNEAMFDESPVHEVTLRSYLIGKCEVSQAEWAGIMNGGIAGAGTEALPVERVSWEDCQEFCKRTGLALPTEEQWEYACRGGEVCANTWREEYEKIRLCNCAGKEPWPAKTGCKNGYGVYNMRGNVWEWCQDAYYVYKTKYVVDPASYVLRGGSWSSFNGYGRCAARFKGEKSVRGNAIGLRVVKNL